ncbi:MAG: glycosyltransferase family 4 protein [Candidatus Bathyarchaeia archaeon]
MKRIHVAVFNTQPPHLYNGGVERRIIEIGKRLAETVDTVVYSGTKAGFKKPARFEGVVIVPCFSTDKIFPVDNWFFNRTLFRFCSKIKADVYEAHTVSGYGFLKGLAKEGSAKPFIHTIHGVLADEYLKSFNEHLFNPRIRLSRFLLSHLSRIEKETAEYATLVVTVSKYSFKRIIQLYQIDENKIRIVPNGVDINKFKPEKPSKNFKRNLGLKDQEDCILFVGNLVPRKGLHLLIKSAEQILKERKSVKFVIAGDGPLKKSLIRYAKENKVSENFIFLGRVHDEVLPKLYNCSDIVVLPSLQEGLGITLLEAQATAKPVVASNVGGTSDIVLNGETGLLVYPDIHEIAEAILKLLSNEALRNQMGSNGRKLVCEKFSWEKCAEKMLNVYREALDVAGSCS